MLYCGSFLETHGDLYRSGRSSGQTKRWKDYLLMHVFVVAVIPVVSGCARDLHADESRTLSRLHDISTIVLELWRRGRSVERVNSFEALRRECVEAGLTIAELDKLERDGWDQPMNWQTVPGTTRHEIRVVSAGSDWTYDDGNDDDVYVRIVIDGPSFQVFRRSPHSRNGREERW
jgi:hypothetical protein